MNNFAIRNNAVAHRFLAQQRPYVKTAVRFGVTSKDASADLAERINKTSGKLVFKWLMAPLLALAGVVGVSINQSPLKHTMDYVQPHTRALKNYREQHVSGQPLSEEQRADISTIISSLLQDVESQALPDMAAIMKLLENCYTPPYRDKATLDQVVDDMAAGKVDPTVLTQAAHILVNSVRKQCGDTVANPYELVIKKHTELTKGQQLVAYLVLVVGFSWEISAITWALSKNQIQVKNYKKAQEELQEAQQELTETASQLVADLTSSQGLAGEEVSFLKDIVPFIIGEKQASTDEKRRMLKTLAEIVKKYGEPGSANSLHQAIDWLYGKSIFAPARRAAHPLLTTVSMGRGVQQLHTSLIASTQQANPEKETED